MLLVLRYATQEQDGLPAVTSGYQRAGWKRAAPQRYGGAKFDKVKIHLQENAAVSPCRTQMNFSSASFDFFPEN